MTRAALTKVLILVIIAFILCLPEFFIVQQVLSVSLLCVRLELCGDEEETAVVWSNSTCPEQWQPLHQRNVTQTDTVSCFVCQANVNNTPQMDRNSSDDSLDVEVSLTFLQPNDTTSAQLTLFSYNHDPRLLHLSDRQESEAKLNYASLHCPPSARGANHSCCLLSLANSTSTLPWQRAEWRYVLRVIWLSLLCVVLLLIVVTVTQQIIEGKRHNTGKSKTHPYDYTRPGQLLIDRAKHTEVYKPMVLRKDNSGCYPRSALSSIEEVETPEECEVFISDNMDKHGKGNQYLHSSSSPPVRTTEQTMTSTEPS